MSWWKTAQITHEANLLRWVRQNTMWSIPALVAAGLITMRSLDYVVQKAKELPALQRPTYVKQVSESVENVFQRNPSVKQEAETLLQEHPELKDIQITTPEEIKDDFDISRLDKSKLPRGIRNNNPGNIDYNSKINWQGTSDKKHDGRFIIFETPEHGLRAMARVLRTYQNRHGLNSIKKIIHRWAPASENNTRSYVYSVAKDLGVGADQSLDLSDDRILLSLMKAIIIHENGYNPYSDNQILEGIKMER